MTASLRGTDYDKKMKKTKSIIGADYNMQIEEEERHQGAAGTSRRHSTVRLFQKYIFNVWEIRVVTNDRWISHIIDFSKFSYPYPAVKQQWMCFYQVALHFNFWIPAFEVHQCQRSEYFSCEGKEFKSICCGLKDGFPRIHLAMCAFPATALPPHLSSKK